MSDDDPTTDDMREQYVAGAMVTGFAYSRREAREDFNRWLAAHDAELREQIATEIEAEAVPGGALALGAWNFATFNAACIARIARGTTTSKEDAHD